MLGKSRPTVNKMITNGSDSASKLYKECRSGWIHLDDEIVRYST